MALSLLEGNEAIGWGALAAGCRFFAGYPITPATTVYNTMLKLLPPAGGICMQAEDEIASMGFCLGAAMTGLKVLTATSGPGISLYSEQISFAVGSEIPLVIVNVQRLGPSTGSATKGADGDIQFMRWGSSSGQPVIVLAPVDGRDCYTLTVQAFNLAETYRCPVFIASNKEIAMTRETLDLTTLELPAIQARKQAAAADDFLPFAARGEDGVPDFLPIGGPRLVRQTSSTHGPDGYITTDPAVIAQTQARLFKKVESAVDRFTFFDFHGAAQGDCLIITYGVSARAARSALAEMDSGAEAIGLLVLKTLWPVPEALIQARAGRFRRIVVLEMNLGQYVREIQRLLPGKSVEFLGRMDGELITPRQIKEVLSGE
ncbi:MAG: pyruvate flavodoxin/ferredoxin oxidoreductase [Desulfobacterales bacterium]